MGGGLLDSDVDMDVELHKHPFPLATMDRIAERRQSIQSYVPGRWVAETGGFDAKSFAVPSMTTLLVVGPMGAGKSTLINNVIRVVNDMDTGFDRAQVCDDPSENGTLFLKEHVLCNTAKNICLFDTRGFSEMDVDEDLSMVRDWMKSGVKHGGIVQRSTGLDTESLHARARHGHHLYSVTRQVNFVIFVVSAVAIHKEATKGAQLARLYKSSYLTFKDDRPVVVMTHGDELSPEDRIAARLRLGEILGVSAANQIFDIAGYTGRYMDKRGQDLVADLTTLEMIEYALMRADRNLCYKQSLVQYITKTLVETVADKDLSGLMHFLFLSLAAWVTTVAVLGYTLRDSRW